MCDRKSCVIERKKRTPLSKRCQLADQEQEKCLRETLHRVVHKIPISSLSSETYTDDS